MASSKTFEIGNKPKICKDFNKEEWSLLNSIVINLGPPNLWRPRNYRNSGKGPIQPGMAPMLYAEKGTHLNFQQRFYIAIFTFMNGCPSEIIDSWLDTRELLANKGAYNHMASLWRDLKSKQWT